MTATNGIRANAVRAYSAVAHLTGALLPATVANSSEAVAPRRRLYGPAFALAL